MEENIKTEKAKIKYSVRKSNRAKRMRVAVYCDTRVIVTAPWGFEESKIEKFIKEKSRWIMAKVKYFAEFKHSRPINSGRENYLKYKNIALDLAKEKAGRYNQIYNFRVNSINIKNQRARWGSCSAKGNLNFNYKIALLPEKFADYIIIHELCHLKEFNHSKRFWNLVAILAPDYQAVKKELRVIGLGLQ